VAQLVVALGGVGHLQVGLGRFAEAAESLERALTETRRQRTGTFEQGRILVDLSRARLGLGDRDAAPQCASSAVEIGRRQGSPRIECLALLNRARVARATGGTSADVDADLTAALAHARELGASLWEAEIQAEREEPRPHWIGGV
jgi:hypothetical protein